MLSLSMAVAVLQFVGSWELHILHVSANLVETASCAASGVVNRQLAVHTLTVCCSC